MGLERSCRSIAGWPPDESPLGQSLLRHPKPLAIECQDLNCRGPPAAKNEQAAGKRIGPQFFPAQLRQSINALPQVDGLDGYQYAHLRRDLNHADSHSPRLSPARAGWVLPFHGM